MSEEHRTALELEWSPSSRVDDLAAELHAYAEAGERARSLPHHIVSSGTHSDEWAVLFGSQVDSPAESPLHVFVHGGYWQALSAWDGAMVVPALTGAGHAVGLINYSLAPGATIGRMIEQCCDGLDALVAATGARHVTLSGSSAGAHLAAHVALRRPVVSRLVLLSGIYDLAPLVNTYVNDALALDVTSAAQWSIPLQAAPACEVLVVHGEHETDVFKAESARIAASWAVPVVEVAGRNHFDLVFDLAQIDLLQGDPGHPEVQARHPGSVHHEDVHPGSVHDGDAHLEVGAAARPPRVSHGSLLRVAAP